MLEGLPHVLLEQICNESPDLTGRTQLAHIVAADLEVEILELGVLDTGSLVLRYEVVWSLGETIAMKVDERSRDAPFASW